jgi:hypothetical protein
MTTRLQRLLSNRRQWTRGVQIKVFESLRGDWSYSHPGNFSLECADNLLLSDFLWGMQTQPPLYTLSGFSLGVQAISTLYSQDFLSSAAANHQLPFVQCHKLLALSSMWGSLQWCCWSSQLLAHSSTWVFNHILPKLPPSCIAKKLQSFTISPWSHTYVILALTVMIIAFQKFSRSYVSSTKSTCFHYHPMV